MKVKRSLAALLAVAAMLTVTGCKEKQPVNIDDIVVTKLVSKCPTSNFSTLVSPSYHPKKI